MYSFDPAGSWPVHRHITARVPILSLVPSLTLPLVPEAALLPVTIFPPAEGPGVTQAAQSHDAAERSVTTYVFPHNISAPFTLSVSPTCVEASYARLLYQQTLRCRVCVEGSSPSRYVVMAGLWTGGYLQPDRLPLLDFPPSRVSAAAPCVHIAYCGLIETPQSSPLDTALPRVVRFNVSSSWMVASTAPPPHPFALPLVGVGAAHARLVAPNAFDVTTKAAPARPPGIYDVETVLRSVDPGWLELEETQVVAGVATFVEPSSIRHL